MRARMGDAFDPKMLDEKAMKSAALDRLIRDQLMVQAADNDGFAISQQRVAAEIGSLGVFKKDDVFSSKKYEHVLQTQGLSPAEFERIIYNGLLIQQFTDGISKTAESTPAMLTEIYRLQVQKRRFRYLTLPVSRFSDKVTVSDTEIQQFYKDHSADFKAPERVKLQYVELIEDTLPIDETVEEKDLRALYEEQLNSYVTPEERRARHILVSIPPDATEDVKKKAHARATLILERLKKGEAFAEIAKSESDDPGSAAKGGDLGFFGKGIMSPEFEKAAFSLPKGELSGIVTTPFGLHIIEVTDIKPEVTTPFEAVRDDLFKEFFSEKRNDLYLEDAESLANIAFEQPDSLDGVSSELGLEIKTSDWLTRKGGPGVGEYPQIVEAAFSQDIIESRDNSEPVEVDHNHLVVFRVLEHEPAETEPLDKIRPDVERKVHDIKVRELVRTTGEQLLDNLKSGMTAEAVATKQKLEVKDSGFVNRTGSKLDQALITEVFKMPPGTDNHPSVHGMALLSGDYVILLLDEIRDGDITKLSAADRRTVAAKISLVQGKSEFSAAIDALEANAAIIIPNQNN